MQIADPKVPPELRVCRKDCNFVIASHSFQGKIKNMEVVENHIRRSLFWVQGDKRVPGVERTTMPKALPEYSGGELPGRSTVEEGREEEEAEEGRRMENELMNAILAGEPRETRSRGWGYSEGCACSLKH